MAVFPVSCDAVCGPGLLGVMHSPKGLDVQGLIATEQGDSEILKGYHVGHPALDGKGSAHSHPCGLQLQ